MRSWYKVTFNALLNEEEVRDLNKHLFDVLEEDLDLESLANLEIEEEVDQPMDIIEIDLESDFYELSSDFGILKIKKDKLDSAVRNTYIDVTFIDEDNQPTIRYKVITDDSNWVYCEYIGE